MAKVKNNRKVKCCGIKNRIDVSIFCEESEERTLRRLSKNRYFKAFDEELQLIASEIANIYFRDGITYREFTELVFRDYPKYIENFNFEVYLGQAYRKLYREYLINKSRKEEMLNKVISGYQRKYKKGR